MRSADLEAARKTLALALDGAPEDTISYKIRRELLNELNTEHDARERLKAALNRRRAGFHA
jgi:Tfp pilus assembly protein PilF